VPNTFIKPSVVAKMALATLYNDSVMLPLVTRDFDGDFSQAQGDTVTVRKPGTFTANQFNQAVGISLQNMTETSTSIVLNKIFDVSIPVTSKDYTLEIADFQAQIVAPAMEAISQAVDALILGLRSDVVQSVTLSKYNASTAPHPLYDLIDAGRKLTTKGVPRTDRVAVVDEFIGAQWRRDDLSNRADANGSTTALESAFITGKTFGFDAYETNNIDDFTGVAFHPSAFVFASRPLALPKGASNAAVVNYKGLSVRMIMDYDPTYKQDIISLDILCGVKTLDPNRAVLLAGLADSV
jgi:hypothetical protein